MSMDLPWHDHMRSDAFYRKLDPGIRFAVRVLHAAGVQTGQSCEGGEGHAYDRPTVDLWGGSPSDGYAAFAALDGFDLGVRDISRVWRVERGDLTEPLWRVTFWRPCPERADEVPMFIHGYRHRPEPDEADGAQR